MADVKIDLTIIGAQKAGTTALALYLNQNPKIYFPAVKETHFFRRPLLDSGPADRDAELLNRRFLEAPPGAMLADGTPIYLYWPHAIELLKAHNPAMKLIVALRHPVARAYSAWSMERRRDREPLSFSEAIREGRTRVQDAPFGVHHIYSYVERGFYARQLARVHDRFSPDQVFVLRSDQITASNARMSALQRFLEVDPIAFHPIDENVNPSSLAPFPELQRDFAFLQDLYNDDLAELADMVDLDISDWFVPPAV